MAKGHFSITDDSGKEIYQTTFLIDALKKTSEPAIINQPAKEDKLIPIKSAPDTALCSRSTLDRMKDLGEISYVKIRGRVFFYESVLLSIRKEIRLKGIKY